MTDFLTLHRLATYRSAKQELLSLKHDRFPVPCVVKVECSRFKGMGIIVNEWDDVPPDMLWVTLENGNIGDYPLESCERVDNEAEWPKWIREGMSK